jgi:3D (Asp-Asp-Asp) domain-containing protein
MSITAAALTLTLSFLTTETNIDKKGHSTTKETIAYTTSVIPYESMTACTNGREEWNLAVGAYQMSKRPTRIITAVCNDSATGTVQ